jgi:hypothetical protein
MSQIVFDSSSVIAQIIPLLERIIVGVTPARRGKKKGLLTPQGWPDEGIKTNHFLRYHWLFRGGSV